MKHEVSQGADGVWTVRLAAAAACVHCLTSASSPGNLGDLKDSGCIVVLFPVWSTSDRREVEAALAAQAGTETCLCLVPYEDPDEIAAWGPLPHQGPSPTWVVLA